MFFLARLKRCLKSKGSIPFYAKYAADFPSKYLSVRLIVNVRFFDFFAFFYFFKSLVKH